MRILHIINSLDIGGAEKVITYLLPVLNKSNEVQVDLLILKLNDRRLYEELKEAGVNVMCLDTKKSLRSPLIVADILPFFYQEYDVIHAHLFPTQYWVTIARILVRKSKTKLVFTEHSTSNRRISSFLFSIIDKKIYAFLDTLVCISKEIEDIYLQYQRKLKDKTAVIHNGVPINKIQVAPPASRFEISDNLFEANKVILHVAGFKYPKNQPTLIKSLLYLPDNFKVVFAGDGESRSESEILVEELGLQKRVYFLGNRDDVYSLQKMSDYLVLSTRYEGLSLACIEGMASGKPFIASDVNGVRELVGGAGILFEEGNSVRLAEIILELDSDAEYKNSVVQRCQKRANEYSIEKMAEEHIKLYQSVLSR